MCVAGRWEPSPLVHKTAGRRPPGISWQPCDAAGNELALAPVAAIQAAVALERTHRPYSGKTGF
jgi:hypothetical protein